MKPMSWAVPQAAERYVGFLLLVISSLVWTITQAFTQTLCQVSEKTHSSIFLSTYLNLQLYFTWMIWNEALFFLSLALLFTDFCFQNLCNISAAKSKSCAIITPTNRSYFCKLKSCREGLKEVKELSTHSFLTYWAGTQENKQTNQPEKLFDEMGEKKYL